MRIFRHGAFLLLARFAALFGMCVWLGGFTFYGGIVVPILDDAFGQLDTGMLVTRYATKNLNLIGFSTVSAWWWLLLFERAYRPRLIRWGRGGLLGISTVMLVFLLILHTVMESHLDQRGVKDFKPLHRTYLMVSTIQWAANLGILLLTIRIWTGGERTLESLESTEGSTASL